MAATLSTPDYPPMNLGQWRQPGYNGPMTWPGFNPSSGIYAWTQLTNTVSAIPKPGPGLEITWGQVPSWVNSTPCLSNSTMQTDWHTFMSAYWLQVGPGTIKYAGDWNEFNVSTFWSCLDGESEVSALSVTQYSAAKSIDPNVNILSANINLASGDNRGLPYPYSPFNHYANYLAGCISLAPQKCFDVLDFHSYIGGWQDINNDADTEGAPEFLPTYVNRVRAVAYQYGFGSYPVSSSEGMSGYGILTANLNTQYFAGIEARHFILLASVGVNHWNLYVYNSASIGSIESIHGPDNIFSLNLTGQALNNVNGWLAGATFTSPMARIAGANLVSNGPTSGSPSVGLITGSGGCSGAPSGTATLPTNWAVALGGHAFGMSLYLTNFGTDIASGLPYAEFRLCGTDTRAGSGIEYNTISIGGAISASLGQNFIVGNNTNIISGSLTGIQLFGSEITENNSSGSYLGNHNDATAWTSSATLLMQKSEARFVTQQPTIASVRDDWEFANYWNSTTPIPIDVTFRIGAPDLERGNTQWEGTITEANGSTAIIAWDAAGCTNCAGTTQGQPANVSTLTVPSQYIYYRDVFNVVHPIIGNSVPLSDSPVLIEASAWKGLIAP